MSTILAEPINFAPLFTARQIGPGPTQDAHLLDKAYQLRFQVYCLECAYLDAIEHPQGREVDDHDAHASHFVALNLQDELVGYVRLVHPDAQGCFPLQHHGLQLHEGYTVPPPAESAEISRLMISPRYRRRRGDKPSGVTVQEEHEQDMERRASSPQILLSMYRQMYQHSLQHNIRYWYAAMERYLAVALKSMNFGFEQIGPYTDYYGPVAPFLGDLRKLEDGLRQSSPQMLAWMQGDL